MLKQELRNQRLAERKALSKQQLAQASLDITDRLFQSFSLTNKTVHVFLPILHQNEVNTWLLVDRLQSIGKVVVPKSNSSDYTMEHFLLTANTVLKENEWKIVEPENGEAIQPKALDVVLVPLLAFDKKGHRVGYGKGFYDRFLAQLKPDTLKIGLCLAEVEEAFIEDIHENDIALDFCVTPNHLYTFA